MSGIPSMEALSGSFDTVLDVGGFLGEFADACVRRWTTAHVLSFEPNPLLAERHRATAAGRWDLHDVALGSSFGRSVLHVCVNQLSASTMREPGTTRAATFGISDRFELRSVPVHTLDGYAGEIAGRCLLKIDVEGSELDVLRGGVNVLPDVDAAIIEVQQDSQIFLGSPPVSELDELLRAAGLHFAGVVGALLAPASGRVLQYDGLWTRYY